MPLPDEVDIRPLLEEVLRKQHPLYLPRYEEGVVSFHRVESLDELRVSSLRIPEPQRHDPPPEALDVVLVPGRAFDPQGNRLGRGKGGYDRFIAEQRMHNPKTEFWGVAYQEQMTDHLPSEPHDQRMDAVITPEKVFHLHGS
jgi:5-formyltetrahydrofolate cyclo-ligase